MVHSQKPLKQPQSVHLHAAKRFIVCRQSPSNISPLRQHARLTLHAVASIGQMAPPPIQGSLASDCARHDLNDLILQMKTMHAGCGQEPTWSVQFFEVISLRAASCRAAAFFCRPLLSTLDLNAPKIAPITPRTIL